MNAKEEFINEVGDKQIKCAIITKGDERWNDDFSRHILKINHNLGEYNDFLDSLDFEYNNGYGGQNLFGTIWYIDGTWSERGEYDGSEWWSYQSVPDIPEELC